MSTGPVPPVFVESVAAVRVERDVITAAGPDAEKYLQGQLSQDMARLGPGGSAWSLLLQPQGRLDAWLRVSRLDDDRFLLDLDAGAGAAALARLERFLLRTDCSFDLATWNIVSCRGPGSGDLVLADFAGAVVVADPEWPGVDGMDALGPEVEPPPRVSRADPDDLETLRIVCGVPAMGRELDESVIPAEAGIVEVSVSFTKGCYTGQELVSRIDSRGNNVPRRLAAFMLDGVVEVGSRVRVGEAEVGVVTSVAATGSPRPALGYVKRGTDLPAVGAVAGVAVEILPISR